MPRKLRNEKERMENGGEREKKTVKKTREKKKMEKNGRRRANH